MISKHVSWIACELILSSSEGWGTKHSLLEVALHCWFQWGWYLTREVLGTNHKLLSLFKMKSGASSFLTSTCCSWLWGEWSWKPTVKTTCTVTAHNMLWACKLPLPIMSGYLNANCTVTHFPTAVFPGFYHFWAYTYKKWSGFKIFQ